MSSDNRGFDRSVLEQMLSKRFFYAPAFAIYGGIAGLYDYGPPGTALQSNLLSFWRQHFVIEEDMLELDTTVITPEVVLETSGHVEKFADWMVKDLVNGEIFRADHLVEGFLEAGLEGDKLARQAESGKKEEETKVAVETGDKKKKERKKKNAVVNVKLSDEIKKEYEEILAKIDNYDGAGLQSIIAKYDIKSPEGNNPLSEPKEFNLMFATHIGPSGQVKGYLRPETAQGQFVNFKKLLEFNNEKLPFASAQIGRSFRNEISPRSGLLRVREFTMGEIEHFVDPEDKSHDKFDEVKSTKLRFLSAKVQLEGRTEIQELTVEEAVATKLVDNETLGYFLARIYLYLTKIGINPIKLRFRQHMSNEMAHYACDCWDAEILTSYGWIECVGCADRSAYDLTVHTNKTKEKLVVRKPLPQPITKELLQVALDKKVFGIKLKKSAKLVESHLLSLDQNQLQELRTKLESGKAEIVAEDKNTYELTSDMLTIDLVTVTEHVREFTPNVIEPSFGIGRILYSLLEHSYWIREESQTEGEEAKAETRGVLSFPVGVAPIKCLILPLSNKPEYNTLIKELGRKLRQAGLTSKVDDSSASIGRRYARNDELGTPFAITIDPQTLTDGSITLRERDSTNQIRDQVSVVLELLQQLVDEKLSWAQVIEKHPIISN